MRTPDAIALRSGPSTLTYGELERRANRLAERLRVRGVTRDQSVGIVAERSVEAIVGMLGILKAGASYLPLDPAYPAERLAFLLADANVRLVVAPTSAHIVVPDGVCEIIGITGPDEGVPEAAVPADVGSPLDLAYIMFTSGSTGVPKGVAVTHRAVVRLVRDTGYVGFAGETLLQFAPLTFDASTFEVWGALLNGGTLALAPPGTLALSEIGRAIVDAKVTTAWLTAGLFHQMVDHECRALQGLRQLIAGGDVLSVRHVRQLLQAAPQLRLVNGFGPTETTTFACCHPMSGAMTFEQGVPIGRPIANTRAFVLDRRGEPVPVGVAGELYIGGDALARGYVARPELTADRFVPDPFSPERGARLYRTGDRARWLADGTIEFLGRRDRQVKIRGFRVEAGEIEAALAALPAVRGAVVVTRQGERGERDLNAYVEADAGPDATPESLRARLRERLPDYMVPARIVRLDALPLTANGKVDAAALPAPEARAEEIAVVAPRTPDEAALARIWIEVLQIARVGVEDDFFALGGHSLLATQVVARVRDEMAVDVSLRALFNGPTVAALAVEIARVRGAGPAPASAIQSIPRSAARRRAGSLSPTS